MGNFSIRRAAALIAVLTLFSRLVGLLRLELFASRFGAGDILDIYYASFRIPDLIFNLLILGTLSAAFIPVFSGYWARDREEANRVASSVLNAAMIIMFALCLILFFAARPIMNALLPGFDEAKLEATVSLTRLMLVSPLLFTLSNLISSILMSFKRFFLVNLAPIFYNLGIIFGLEVLYPRLGLLGLGLGVIVGAALHFLIQIPGVIRGGFTWSPVLLWKHSGVRAIFTLFIPRIFSLDPSLISLLIASVIGSVLAAGSISVFNLANDLQAAPLGIIAVSTAIAVFPVLSERYNQRDGKGYLDALGEAIIQVLFFIIPLSILMLLLRAHIVRLILGHGQFNWDNTILTFNTFGVFTFSLFSQSLIPLLARAFYARHNTKLPVIIGLITLAFNATLSYIFAMRFGVVGVALGFTIASIINCLMLFIVLRRQLGREAVHSAQKISKFDLTLIAAISKILLATIGMGVVSYGTLYAIAPLVNTRTTLGILIQSGTAVAAGIIIYAVIGYLIGLHETKQLLSFLKKLVYKSQVASDSPQS